MSVAGCADRTAMHEQHEQEDQAMLAAHQAGRQLARAQDEVSDTLLLSGIAASNLAAKQQKQADADAALKALVCPSPTVEL
ncbi:hypothetical protein CEQ28_023215 [Hafnia alvei]|nr:hypothetical protein CEQ28_023215 [Hafnia alvei]